MATRPLITLAAMETFEIGPWRVESDPASTRQAYAAGTAVQCDCGYCMNFWAARSDVYPDAFLDLLARLGVDSHSEDEVSEYGPARGESWWADFERRRGRWQEWRWLYLGAFWALGRVSGPPARKQLFADDTYEIRLGPHFSYELAPSGDLFTAPPDDSPFGNHPRFAISLMAEVPWVLKTPPWELPRG